MPGPSITRLKALPAAARRRPGLALALLATAIVVVSAGRMLTTQLDQSGDHTYHLQCEGQVAQALSEGRSPFGPLSMTFGTPMLKFYQPLFYLITGSLNALLGIDLLLLHNLLTFLFFMLMPLALYRGYHQLGLPEPAAGLAALLSLLSVAGFGASYESFFTTGLVTQALGAVFFPLFIGQFARLLSGRSGPVSAALLFGLSFVAHAMVAVYAVFSGALLFLVSRWDLRRIWKPLVVFSLLASLLVVFWLVPFLSHRSRHRPVPDVVALSRYSQWSTGLSAGQATRLLFSGRLLDDARTRNRAEQTADDRLIDRINIAGTLVERPPVLTALVLLGLALCLTRLRSTGHRFMVAGFLFSFLLLMGPDDVGWLAYLPFAQRLQFFRCVYLLEFFAFGLAGAGLLILYELAERQAARFGRGPGVGVRVATGALGLAALVWMLVHIAQLSSVHVNPGSSRKFEAAERTAAPIAEGFPLRVVLDHGHFRTDKRRLSFMASRRQRTVCGHWRLLGPTIGAPLCERMRRPGAHLELARRIGIGYYLVNRKRAGALNKVTNPDGSLALEQVNRGGGSYLYRDTGARYGWIARRPVLVVADEAQWYLLGASWVERIARAGDAEPPTPVWSPGGVAFTDELLAPMDAVLVLAPERLGEADRKALATRAAAGLPVFSVAPLQGVTTRAIDASGPAALDLLPGLAAAEAPPTSLRLGDARVGGPFAYQIEARRASVLVLPDFAAPGWNASVDGEPAAALAAGPDFTAAVVPAGRHEVRLWWSTPPVELAITWLSLAGWVGAAGVLIAGAIRRRRSA